MSSSVNKDNQPQESQAVSKAQVEAILVLIKAVNLAQSRGAYSLDEAKTVSEACGQFIVKQDGAPSTNALASEQQPNQRPDFSKLRVDS